MSLEGFLESYKQETNAGAEEMKILKKVFEELKWQTIEDLVFSRMPKPAAPGVWSNWNGNQKCQVKIIKPSSLVEFRQAVLEGMKGGYQLIALSGYKHSWSPIICKGKVLTIVKETQVCGLM